MNQKLFRSAVALLVCVGATTPARAWNSFGHMTVALLAITEKRGNLDVISGFEIPG